MLKKEKIIKDGVVIEVLPSTTFKIRLDEGQELLAHLSGKMRLHYIRILLGDRVKVEIDTYNESRGRIIRRL